MVSKVKSYVDEMATNYPGIKAEIYGIYELFLSEIEDDSASIQHEADLCFSSIDELIAAHLED